MTYPYPIPMWSIKEHAPSYDITRNQGTENLGCITDCFLALSMTRDNSQPYYRQS